VKTSTAAMVDSATTIKITKNEKLDNHPVVPKTENQYWYSSCRMSQIPRLASVSKYSLEFVHLMLDSTHSQLFQKKHVYDLKMILKVQILHREHCFSKIVSEIQTKNTHTNSSTADIIIIHR